MALRQLKGLTWTEVVATVLLVAAGLFAVGDGLRLLARGSAAASWTATYIIVAGLVLALLAAVSLLPFSRKAAAKPVTSSVTEGLLDEADKPEGEDAPVLDEEVAPEEARRLLLRSTGLLILWILALPYIGYIAATALFLIVYTLGVSKRRVLHALIFAVIATALSALLFQSVGVRLPPGSLWS